jgi:hypothetical protein
MDSQHLQRIEMQLSRLLHGVKIAIKSGARESIQVLQDRYDEPRSLIPHGYKVYSQNDEDGLIGEIFKRVGVTEKVFVEFGAGTGLENNTLFLLHQGWRGLWLDASDAIERASVNYSGLIDKGQLRIQKARVLRDNINSLISAHITDKEIDLLSVDIDGNDYHILNAIDCVDPRVIVVEYNAKFPPPVMYCMSYDEQHSWDGSDHFGASLQWFEVKMNVRGYRLVGCNLTGTNAFFVREDLVGDKFLEPFTAEKHYQPARYELSASFSGLSGHPASYKTLANASDID